MIEIVEKLQQHVDATGAGPLLDLQGEVSSHTRDHSVRLGNLAVELRLGPEVAFAALMHDNGKVEPTITGLIESPKRLTDEERGQVFWHTLIGEHNLSRLEVSEGNKDLLRFARFVARHHHDSWEQLAVLELAHPQFTPLIDATRWVKTVDVYDALRDPNRPYRDPAPEEVAAQIALDGMHDAIILGKTATEHIEDARRSKALQYDTLVAV